MVYAILNRTCCLSFSCPTSEYVLWELSRADVNPRPVIPLDIPAVHFRNVRNTFTAKYAEST